MKAIILTMTSGEGHNNMSKVISKQLAEHGVESEIVDIFKHDGFEYRFNNWGYLFICSYFPKTYDYFWKQLKFRKSERRYHGIAQQEVEKVADKISSRVDEIGCDFFVCVHAYTAMLCDYWRRQGKYADKKVFALLPDILPHPLWESAIECDYILTPTDHCFDQLAFKGFRPEQCVVSGFPVAKKFTEKADKTETRKSLGLQDKFTVLIVSGGYGIGRNWKVVKKLLKNNVQLLCVNGRNKKAFKKTQRIVDKHKNADVKNFGFVDNIDQLMSASDAIVCRGGGGSVFEALNKRLPLIIREKMIINERENAEILQDAGAAIRLKKLSDVSRVVDDLRAHPEKLAAMQQAAEKVAKSLCVEDVCRAMLERL